MQQGAVTVEPAAIRGGAYDPAASSPAENLYRAVYRVALVPADAAPQDGDFVTLGDSPHSFPELAPGEYALYVRDSAGSESFLEGGVLVAHPEVEWSVPSYVWSEDYSSVTASRVCSLNETHRETETAASTASVSQQPSCTEPGKTCYTASFTNPAFYPQTRTVENLDPIGHAYELTAWSWTGYSAATATFTCANDPSHRETLEAEITAVRTEPTAEEDGSVVYTATVVFEGRSYKDSRTEILPAMGHDYVLSGWTWEGFSAASATFTDRNGGADLILEASITGERTEPGCETEGSIVYTAAVSLNGQTYTDTKTETLPAVGYDWDDPTYEWAADCSEITATRVCKNDPEHKETEQSTVTAEITKEATYDEEGEITYTASFVNPAFAEQIRKVVTPKLIFRPCDGDDCPGSIFTDMPPKSHWSHDAIDWALVRGITSGTSETTFGPKLSCKREQFLTFLWIACGRPAHQQTENPFTDVKEGKYYCDAVLWAYENKLTSGVGEGLFGVGLECSRAHAVTFLWLAAGKPAHELTENPFTDVKEGKYYYDAVLWAYENGLTSGVGEGLFGVSKAVSRAQAVSFLYHFCE